MTGREWQPGEVMLSRGERGMATGGLDGDIYIEMADGRCLSLGDLADDARPLAVIDPENAEGVERLVSLFMLERTRGERDAIVGGTTDAMRAALLEFADPKPRIEEPTRFGAMVEDADGRRWVLRDTSVKGGRGWVAEEKIGLTHWSEISAVRILFEGIQ